MDRRLLQYYERELRLLRELGAPFARHFPKIAGRLSPDELTHADPYVERLLEGFAYMAARVFAQVGMGKPLLACAEEDFHTIARAYRAALGEETFAKAAAGDADVVRDMVAKFNDSITVKRRIEMEKVE